MRNAILLSAIAFLLSGCFEVREEIDLKADGSGRVTFTLNMSESKGNLANYMKVGSVNGKKTPTRQEIEAEIIRFRKVFAASKGISEVRTSSNFDDFIFSVSALFDNVQNLNAAINQMAASVDPAAKTAARMRNYGHSGGAFTRYFEYPVEPLEYEGLTKVQQYMLESARVVSIYRFQQPIREYSNRQARIAPNRRAIKLELTLGALLKGTGAMTNSIAF